MGSVGLRCRPRAASAAGLWSGREAIALERRPAPPPPASRGRARRGAAETRRAAPPGGPAPPPPPVGEGGDLALALDRHRRAAVASHVGQVGGAAVAEDLGGQVLRCAR